METALKILIAKLIVHFSRLYNLEPSLVASIAYKESLSGAPTIWDGVFATRYEPAFFTRYIENKDLTHYIPKFISRPTERKHRATSWGMMQIMGQTAREFGFKHECIATLILPWRNIEMACQILSRNISQNGLYNGVRRYNGSLMVASTAAYADDVFKIQKNKTYQLALGEI